MWLKHFILSSCCALPLIAGIVADASFDASQYSAADIIHRDVVVIGGGSTGTYSAVHLRDHNYTVAVIEAQNHLGGHAETYTAPNGFTIDIGVVVFGNTSTVKNYFSRFNVPLFALGSSGGPPAKPNYVDFSTGKTVPSYSPPAPADIGAAYAGWSAQLAKYPALDKGFFLTYPVADDLLISFGEFVQKYNLSAMVPTVFAYNQGYVPLLNISNIYMLKYLNQGEINSIEKGFLTTVHHDIQELYQNALAYLNAPGNDNVFLNSTVIKMDRNCSPAKILVQTPKGRKLILARRVLNTAPPLPSQLKHFDLNQEELSLFSQFFANGYYTGILTNTSLPANYSAMAVGPGQPYSVPTLPGLYSVRGNAGAPGYIQVYYGSPTPLDSATVQAAIVSDIHKLEAAQNLPTSNPQWAIFSNHSPFNLMVSNRAIKNKFYQMLYGLQGKHNTFWAGAAWQTQDSSVLWDFLENEILPKIVASLS